MDVIDRITKVIDQISIWSGKIVAWLIFPMFMVLVWEVIIRKVYRPTIWANDIATISYGTHFLLAAAFALYLQKHIRTDFVSQYFPLRWQVGLDIAQYLLFFLPGMAMFFWLSWSTPPNPGISRNAWTPHGDPPPDSCIKRSSP